MNLIDFLAIQCFVLWFLIGTLFSRNRKLSQRILEQKTVLEHETAKSAEASERSPSIELDEFLHDMTEHGKGILIVTRAPVEGTLLRSFNGAK
jgi:hypothetical protein